MDQHKKRVEILITLGGSTTASQQNTNWPKHFSEKLSNENYLVINAGTMVLVLFKREFYF